MEKKHQYLQTVTYGDLTLAANQICAFCNTPYNAYEQIPTAHCICEKCWHTKQSAIIKERGYASSLQTVTKKIITIPKAS